MTKDPSWTADRAHTLLTVFGIGALIVGGGIIRVLFFN